MAKTTNAEAVKRVQEFHNGIQKLQKLFNLLLQMDEIAKAILNAQKK